MPTVSDELITANFRAIDTRQTANLKYHRIIDDALFDASLPDASAKGAQIAERIQQEFTSLPDLSKINREFYQLMLILMSCTFVFPPDHHFQNVLLQAFEHLRELPGPHPEAQFRDLHNMQIYLQDFWADN
ncbi:unnamed protein product [Clonostachys rosea]|uniref:Uncharacterized protein n=1 Tax=Bionectria ochroleuca TaxID=29856 RepID=A0ABY6U341_BIOOC|nr:unnamed protein product [Clonostachys rosea]